MVSATIRGSRRCRIAAQRPRPPDDAAAGQHRQGETRPTGSGTGRASTATAWPEPGCATPARRPPAPRAARATRPIAAARSTLGSVRHSATKTTTPQQPDQPKPPAPYTDPARRGQQERQQQREVRSRTPPSGGSDPVLVKSASSSAVRPEVSPSTSAGTKARGSGDRCCTEAPESRRAPAPPGAAAAFGPATVVGCAADPEHRGQSGTAVRRLQPGRAGQSGPDRQPGPRAPLHRR